MTHHKGTKKAAHQAPTSLQQGNKIKLKSTYTKHGTVIPQRRHGTIRSIDQTGRVNVKFDEPFTIDAKDPSATGYTFTSEEAAQFLKVIK